MLATSSCLLARMTSRYVLSHRTLLNTHRSNPSSQARLACTTAWIASPAETVSLLDEIESFTAESEKSNGLTGGYSNGINNPNQESKPDIATSADAAARNLLHAPAIPVHDENSATKDGTISYTPSTYDADESSSTPDDETMSIRSSGTTVPKSAERRIDINGSSISGSSLSFGGEKSSVPDTLADGTAWMNISKGKMNKYAHKYARKEPEPSGGSVNGKNESATPTDSAIGGAAEDSATTETW